MHQQHERKPAGVTPAGFAFQLKMAGVHPAARQCHWLNRKPLLFNSAQMMFS
jgi:hypothetical protein